MHVLSYDTIYNIFKKKKTLYRYQLLDKKKMNFSSDEKSITI